MNINATTITYRLDGELDVQTELFINDNGGADTAYDKLVSESFYMIERKRTGQAVMAGTHTKNICFVGGGFINVKRH